MNCDAYDDFSGDFSSGDIMILALGFSEYDEGLFDVMADIFMSRGSMFFICSSLTLSSLFSIFFQALILLLQYFRPLFLTLIF